jgi:hypothetical protein
MPPAGFEPTASGLGIVRKPLSCFFCSFAGLKDKGLHLNCYPTLPHISARYRDLVETFYRHSFIARPARKVPRLQRRRDRSAL